MDAGETQHLETLLRAFDEVLAYHERAGNRDTATVIELQAKRAQLYERLAEHAEVAPAPVTPP
jgi:hypothetical protein